MLDILLFKNNCFILRRRIYSHLCVFCSLKSLRSAVILICCVNVALHAELSIL